MLMKLKLSLSIKTPAELGHYIDKILKILKAQMNKIIFLYFFLQFYYLKMLIYIFLLLMRVN